MRAVIIDDEQKGINTLKMLIEKRAQDVKVVAQCTKADEGIECIENYVPDIVFLDIHMPRMNGFQLLENLQWKEFSLVFTTAHHEYGLKALKNNAVDYLLKPIDPAELEQSIDKIRSRIAGKNSLHSFNYTALNEIINQSSRQRILVNTKSGVESIDTAQIVRLESRNNYTVIFLADLSNILVAKSLKEFDTLLCNADSGFMRVHQSFIINLNKVSRFLKSKESIVMSDDRKIPVSKSRREGFFRWLNI